MAICTVSCQGAPFPGIRFGGWPGEMIVKSGRKPARFLSVTLTTLALAGISVNDTLVMVDYVNRRLAEGKSLREAALDAGARRFRPIMLTSVTTFVGLLPLLMDRSLQAQFLIPMAVSLAFGVLFATAVTLYLVPCSLLLGQDIRRGTT